MLSVYTNQQELLNATNQTRVSRIETIDKELLDTRQFSVTFKSSDRDKFANLELHVYTPDGIYLTGNHKNLFTIESNDNTSQMLAYQHIAIDTNQSLEDLGITRGQYKLVFNLFDNVLGAYDEGKIWIKEISPSRREIRLQLTDNNNTRLLEQLSTLRARWTAFTTNDIFDSFVLNFGFNETYQIVNFRFDIDNTDTPEVVVKLYNPLPSKYGERAKLWISEEITTPVLTNTTIIPKEIPEPVTNLAPANFELEEYDGFSVATDFKSWNDLLNANLSTSQKIFDAAFSGSLAGIKLNINYRRFDNFVHYSSATERVKNFKYKLQLIEYYSDRIDIISTVSGGYATQTNLNDLFTKRNRIVSTFDDFEKYLFFESTGSRLYTHWEQPSSLLQTSSIDPWPKTTSTGLTWGEAYLLWVSATSTWTSIGQSDPYGYFTSLVRTDSEEGMLYYNDLLQQAEFYDKYNIHKLQNALPFHIQQDPGSEEVILFVHMLGQHFDIPWTYIKELTSIHRREEHPKDGMPNDLLYHVAASMGFELLNGRSRSELWKYTLGTDASGSALQTDVNGIQSIPDQDLTKEVWRRIVNNLPYILKTKGTSRSIKALLTCFGIPSTVLTIKEYGGPSTFTDNDHYPEYVHDKYHYAWYSNSTGSLKINSSSYINGLGNLVTPDTLEFRFKTDNNFTYTSGSAYTILSTLGSSLTLIKETSTDNQATLTYNVNGKSGSIADLEIFDNSWQHITLSNLTNESASLKVCKSKYGKTIYLRSASFATGSGKFTLNEDLYFASGSSKLYGHFHEIRLWSGSLNDATIQEHAASPDTYTYNVDRVLYTTGEQGDKPYEHLLQRFTLANKEIKASPFYQSSVHPNQTINLGAIYFNGYGSSASIAFEGFEETYYTPSPSLGGSSLYTNKVRIESSSIQRNKTLNTKTRVERSSFDRYSLDSNRLGVYFSPQTAINEDIFNQLGYFEIDDYIGDPDDTYNESYKRLTNFAIQYWKKYENRNDFEAYFRALQIYDFTLFKYIKKLLPYRVNAITGIVVEPNVLERSKVRALNKPKIENLTKDVLLVADEIDPVPSAEVDSKLALITAPSPSVTSTKEDHTGIIEGAIDTDRTGTNWIQHRYISKYKLTESGSYKPIQLQILNSRPSHYSVVENTSDKSDLLKETGSFANTSFIRPIIGQDTWSDAGLVASSFEDGYGSGTYNSTFGVYNGLEYPEALGIVGQQFVYGVGRPNPLNFTRYITLEPENFIFDITNKSNTYKIEFVWSASYTKPINHRAKVKLELINYGGSINEVTSSGANRYVISDLQDDNTSQSTISIYSGSFNLEFIPLYEKIAFAIKFNASTAIGVGSADSAAYALLRNFTITQIKKAADIQDSHINSGFSGLINARYNGCKLTGPDINIDTPNTIDGGPVVKVTKVNPNQIVFANNQVTTIDQSTTGVKKPTLPTKSGGSQLFDAP